MLSFSELEDTLSLAVDMIEEKAGSRDHHIQVHSIQKEHKIVVKPCA